MIRYLPWIWVLGIGSGLGILYYSTEAKIQSYAANPPFRWDKNPLDKNWNLAVELGLTHSWDGGRFPPIPRKNLFIEICPSLETTEIPYELFLRESINVDAELRMPKDFFPKKGVLEPRQRMISIQNLWNLETLEEYGAGIWIYGIKLKLPKEHIGCIQGIHWSD